MFRVLAVAGAIGFAIAAGDVLAQTTAPARGARAPAARVSGAGKATADAGPGVQPGASVESWLADAGVVEAKTLDGGTHVFRFREIDIEGRLKSPQLVYFLRRVRAEFAADDLGHRTFLREMSETRREPSF